MNNQYRIVHQYPFWCKLSDTVFEANYVFEGMLLPISYIMYMDKQLQIWVASIRPTSGIVECPRIVIKLQNNGLCLLFDS